MVDLYFTTLPDLFLDYLDLLSYQPSDAVLHTITAFVVDIENALLKCMMGRFYFVLMLKLCRGEQRSVRDGTFSQVPYLCWGVSA